MKIRTQHTNIDETQGRWFMRKVCNVKALFCENYFSTKERKKRKDDKQRQLK